MNLCYKYTYSLLRPSCSLEKEELWVGTFSNRCHYIHDKWLAPAEQFGLQLC